MPGRIKFNREQLTSAVAASQSWSETLRRLGYRPAGGNSKTLQKYAGLWGISSDHFDPYASARHKPRTGRMPLEEILVERSTFSRSHLKKRLLEAGLKSPACELCGQDENWRGRKMALILDHINGVWDDNRIENLRMICPNCAATLDTHCGRKNHEPGKPRSCLRCEKSFVPNRLEQRYCSPGCGRRWNRNGVPLPGARKVERPPREQLLGEIDQIGYLAVGRKYGVSDNAVRKWIRQYERERAIDEGRDPAIVQIPTRTWPNRKRSTKAA